MEIDNKADKKKKKNVLPTVTDPSQKIKLKKLSLESTQFVSGWVFFFFFFFEEKKWKMHPNFVLMGAFC